MEVVAEAVELSTPAPGGGHDPALLDPESAQQAVHALAASRRLHMLSHIKAGDSDPDAAEVCISLALRPLLTILGGLGHMVWINLHHFQILRSQCIDGQIWSPFLACTFLFATKGPCQMGSLDIHRALRWKIF